MHADEKSDETLSRKNFRSRSWRDGPHLHPGYLYIVCNDLPSCDRRNRHMGDG
jgi:hypothetical protein